jgi:hypothetical protein
MAATATITSRDKTINRKIVYGTVVLDSSYATGGESITPASLGLGQIDFITFTNASGYRYEFDYTNNKIMSYTSGGTETTSTTDLSSITARYMAIGK